MQVLESQEISTHSHLRVTYRFNARFINGVLLFGKGLFFSDRREVAITIGIFDLVFDLLPEETLGKKEVWK